MSVQPATPESGDRPDLHRAVTAASARLTFDPLTPGLARAWDRLAVAAGAPPFLRPGWVELWARCFADGRELCVAALRTDGRLDAVLPLLRGRATGGAAASPTNADIPGFDAVVASPSAAEALARGLLSHPDGPNRYDLRFMASDGALAEAIRISAAERGDVRAVSALQRRMPRVDVSAGWPEVSQAWSPSRRKTLRRRERRLGERGRMDVEWHLGGGDPVAERCEEGLRLEASGWKGRQGTATLARPRAERYYRGLLDWADRSGLLGVAYLRLDGRPLAAQLMLCQPPALYLIKSAYDEAFGEFGPGVLLLHRVLRSAAENPEIDVVEMLGEAEGYKLDFADGMTDQVHLQLFRGPLAVHVARPVLVGAGVARSRIRAGLRQVLPPGARRELYRRRAELRRLPATWQGRERSRG
ncbi:MAG TPA: GNAT family N-acetyltransferase [Kineosporiaceae bacterium]|nr:GNAT family N-acetyltransferase [Kineosporiaceae bacterium]